MTESSANSIMILQPYWHAGTWVFDDDAVGLVKEPVVSTTAGRYGDRKERK